LVFLCCLTCTVAGAAPPTLEVKAQTQLALTKVRMDGGGLAEISGSLVDRLTGDGLAQMRVTVRVGDRDVVAITKPDGSFAVDVPVDPGQVTITMSFRGGGSVDPAQPLVVTTDPSRSSVTLTIAKIDDSKAGADLVVRALADDLGVKLPVSIEVGAPGDDRTTPLLRTTTGDTFLLPRGKVGGAGAHHVRAIFGGDDTRQPATADSTVELSASSTTSIDVSTKDLAYEDDLDVTGYVRDDDSAPLPRAAVTLSSGDRRLAQSLTGDDGSFKFKVEGEILGSGQWGVQVLAEPPSTFVKSSRSDIAIVTVARPQPVPVSYTIIGFIASIAAAGGFFIARAKPWERFRRAALAATVDAGDAGAAVPATGGLVANKPSIVSTLRRPQDDGFSGVVRDTVRGRPVDGAVVRLTLGELANEVCTQRDGTFTLDGLAVGEWSAEVAAPGYVTERFGVTIPHRGELRDVRVDLVPVRERVFQLYRRAAEPVLPEPRLWGVWSPRQIVDHVRAKRPSPALAELTDFVEELYFSPRVAAEAVLPGTSERVDRAVRERGRAPSPPVRPSAP
jgi:hypothetical protein